MKKLFATLIVIVMVLALTVCLCACGGGNEPQQPQGPQEPEPDFKPDPEPDPNLKDIEGITFSDQTFTYNGAEHIIEISGTLPEGVMVVYQNNKGTNAGTYNAKAVMMGTGYNQKTLSATLTITPATITGITFTSSSVEYDSLSHNIYIMGNVPSGVICTYTCNGKAFNGAIEAGKYDITATLTNPNYVTLTLNATLTIKATEEMLYTTVFNNAVYFQNSLDNNRLYKYSNGQLTKVNNDIAHYFTTDGANLYYFSSGLISNTIKKLGSPLSSVIYNSGRSTCLATDGTYLYYAKANLIDTKSENGIYKVLISQDEKTATRISTNKASELVYCNGYIYYANASDGNKLYKMSTNGQSNTAVTNKKVTDLTCSNKTVCYTLHEALNSSVYKYATETGTATQLTIDNGAYLTVMDGYVYYVNKDLLTGLFGKGIYRVSLNGGLKQTVIADDDNNGFYSLTSNDGKLYYYKLNDKHLYEYNVSSSTEKDLMQSFTPIDDTTVSGFASLAEHNGEIYYTNTRDNGALYKYNPGTNAHYKILDDCVSNVFFKGNDMYYSTYVLTNYALWRYDMSNAEAEPVKISSNRYEKLIFADDAIYALRITGIGAVNYLAKIDYQTGTETIEYKDSNIHMTSLQIVNGKAYFVFKQMISISGPKNYVYTHTLGGEVKSATDTKIYTERFVTDGSKIYYFDNKNNQMLCCNMDGSNATVIKSDVSVTEIYMSNGNVYFTSNSTANKGIFGYNVSSKTVTKLSSKIGSGLLVYNNNLYFENAEITFTDDYPVVNSGDGHLYQLNLNTKSETVVA